MDKKKLKENIGLACENCKFGIFEYDEELEVLICNCCEGEIKWMEDIMNKELFKKIENEYGCGYWNVCDDHACPCGKDAKVSQGYNEAVYETLKRANELGY